MVYTKERLEEALQIFRQSEPVDSSPAQHISGYKRRLRRKTVQQDLSPKAIKEISIRRGSDKGCSDDEYSPHKPRKRNSAPVKKRKSRKRIAQDTANNEQIVEGREVAKEEMCASRSQEKIRTMVQEGQKTSTSGEDMSKSTSQPPVVDGDSEETPIVIESSPEPDDNLPKVIQTLTHWAHPIDFRHIPSVGEPACHFCSDFRYGMAGLGPIEVELVQNAKGTAFEERSSGHRASGLPTTKMCFSCSMNRLLISDCRCHEMEAISEGGGSDFDPVMFINEICGTSTNFSTSPPFPTCSICLSPAFWKCGASQTNNQYQGLREIKGSTGCGLLACLVCKEFLRRNKGYLHRGLLARFHKQMKSGLPFRADLEFLFPGSLLHQAYYTERA